jgi:hypothetical protein
MPKLQKRAIGKKFEFLKMARKGKWKKGGFLIIPKTDSNWILYRLCRILGDTLLHNKGNI